MPRVQWQGIELLNYLTTNLDDILAAHNCQNVIILRDLNQHLVMRTFTELTVMQGLQNHVDFPTHQRGGSLDPVLTNLASDSEKCRTLDVVDTSDHLAVLSTIKIAPAREEEHHRTTTTTHNTTSTPSPPSSSTCSNSMSHTGPAQRALKSSHGLSIVVVLLLSKNTVPGGATKGAPPRVTRPCTELRAKS